MKFFAFILIAPLVMATTGWAACPDIVFEETFFSQSLKITNSGKVSIGRHLFEFQPGTMEWCKMDQGHCMDRYVGGSGFFDLDPERGQLYFYENGDLLIADIPISIGLRRITPVINITESPPPSVSSVKVLKQSGEIVEISCSGIHTKKIGVEEKEVLQSTESEEGGSSSGY